MKKVLVSLFVLMICCAAFADTSTNNLSADQAANFSNQALYVVTSENTNIYTNLWNYSAYGYSNAFDFYLNGPSYVYTETKINWTPYQGSTQLTKDQFYTIVGRPDEAARYLKFQQSRKTWTGVTVGSLVAGLACAAGGYFVDGTVGDCLYIASGLALLTSGIGLIVLDVVLVEEDEFSVSVAMNAAQSYNVSLLASFSTN